MPADVFDGALLEPDGPKTLKSRASQPGDGSPYKPQRPSAAPSSASPLSPGSGRPGATGYPSYAPRYVQQSPYGGPVAYRESPYPVPRNPSFILFMAEQYRDGMGPALVPTGGTSVQLDFGPPFKKLRFGEPKPDVQQPLRIDTRVSFETI
ncbi:hypothetical protein C0J52_12217 [Blattella germanica]|nr:hypothetical protein C0J52_12217 [Blattella germanica]